MSGYELAQLNIALMTAPLDSPTLKDFVANLDRINALAENSPGYVWRLEAIDGDTAATHPFGEEFLVNLSVWQDIEPLSNFVYQTAHIEIMRRRKEWFLKMREANTVLWWVPAGHRPTVTEAKSKLELLRRNGPSSTAFSFKQPFAKPSEPLIQSESDLCPAT